LAARPAISDERFSGSRGPNGTIGTFSAPFPRATLLNYAGLETLENLIEAYPALVLNPRLKCRLAVWTGSRVASLGVRRGLYFANDAFAGDHIGQRQGKLYRHQSDCDGLLEHLAERQSFAE
jgi:hypothetical protein